MEPGLIDYTIMALLIGIIVAAFLALLPASVVALVATEDGRLDLLIPREIAEGGDTPVPRPVLLLTAFLVKVNSDTDWAEALIEEVFRRDEESGEGDAPPSTETGSEGRVEG